jgi:hypothetical protein
MRRGFPQNAGHYLCRQEWQSAFVCFSAAVEALLTYSTGAGVTERPAKAYATVVARGDTENQEAIEKVRRLYAIRSDIMHGRAYDRKKERKI